MGELYSRIIRIDSQTERLQEILKKQIVGVRQSPKKEFFLKTRVGNQTILFGSLNQIDTKIKKLKAFYHKAIKDKTLETYKKINLMYNDQVVCL